MIERPIQQFDLTDDYKAFWFDIVKKASIELYGDINNFCETYRKSPNKIYNDINKMLLVVPITLRKLIDEIFTKEYGNAKDV